MKKIFATGLFLVFLGTYAQGFQRAGQEPKIISQSVPDVEDHQAFVEMAETYNIPSKTFQNSQGLVDGFYVISGVFSKNNNLDREVNKLAKKGFDPGYFQNAEDNKYYLYLNRYDSWQDALQQCNSKFDNRYKKQVWVLKVADNAAQNEPIPLEDVSYDMLKDAAQAEGNTDVSWLSDTSGKEKLSASKSKLLSRADEYFDKMWYAEAAKLYEEALGDNPQNFSADVLQKAGDSYYFNTNMEQAYKYYNILYDKYGDDLSSNNIFKYAHALKGTGKYGRSKRLMRLYNKKMQAEGLEDLSLKKEAANEVLLDNLLETKKDIDLKNLAVNTKYSEFGPMFYNNDEIVFASAMDSSTLITRKYKWNDQPYLDLYVAKLNEESGDLKNALKFSKELNTKYHEAAVTFAPDGNTIYFTRNNYGKKLKRDKNGINNLKIYTSKKVDGEWTPAQELPFCSDEYSTGHPALSKDGKKLYFSSDMPGTMGETDIFVVDILEDGGFSSPKNLGPAINTEHKELFPFVNNEKLYFSSDGHTGLGGLDIFEAKFLEDGSMDKVVNLGQPINSNKDDFSYIINEESQKGYFASNRQGGKGDDDLYSFKRLEPEITPVNAIAGVVVDMITEALMPKALVELLDENNIKLMEMMTDEQGSFIFEGLDANTRYNLKVTHDTYFENTMPVSTLENDTVNVEVKMRKLEQMIAVEDGIKKLKTEMIHFDFDKHYIRTDAAVELDKLVEVMNEYPNMVIKIESHTDSRGSREYNRYLSDRRAKSTKEYIISKGIDPSRIESAIGYGEDRLLNECDGTVACTEAKHFLNRRSEFIIVKM